MLKLGDGIGHPLKAGVGQMLVPYLLTVPVHEVEDVVFAGYVVVELAHRHVAGECNIADRCAVEALLEQDLARPVDNLPLLHLGQLAIRRSGHELLEGDSGLHLRQLTARRADERRTVLRLAFRPLLPLAIGLLDVDPDTPRSSTIEPIGTKQVKPP